MSKSGRLLASLLVGLGLSSTAQAADPIKIGVIASYSGPYADYGRQFDMGMDIYLKEHDGKIGGHPVEIIRRDAPGAAPDVAKRMAQELVVKEKVNFFAGLDFSPNAYAVGAIATQAKIPTIVMNASSSGIPTKSPYVARVSFTVEQVSAPMAKWAFNQGIKSVYLIAADYGPGHSAESAFEKAFTAAGGTIVGKVRTPMSNPDFSAYIQRVKDEKPEAVFFFFPSGVLPPAFLKTWKERGLDEDGIKLIATGEATDDSYLEATGDVALGLITSHHYSRAHDSALNKAFVKATKGYYNGELAAGYFSVAAYDGLAALDMALQKTGGDIDPDKVMEALKGLKFESPRGPIEIDAETRDIIQTVYIRKVERVDGELVNVEFDKFDAVKDPGKE
ncbi:ABC transporter substrate-binding protein [Rhodospirillum sp. A1_3_36]|uniref:ABC transporter substrate-binding protein n=1 Tax=Rhodospirillum sp. A1_3_36 TaxID=3391666 RepID=UPI0039A5E126